MLECVLLRSLTLQCIGSISGHERESLFSKSGKINMMEGC